MVIDTVFNSNLTSFGRFDAEMEISPQTLDSNDGDVVAHLLSRWFHELLWKVNGLSLWFWSE